MHRHYALWAFALLVSPATASERGDWFESLTVPGTHERCCSIADCTRTEAVFKEGHWWAKLHGNWQAVPNETILDTPSLDGAAYICADLLPTLLPNNRNGTKIYCLVPPDWGM